MTNKSKIVSLPIGTTNAVMGDRAQFPNKNNSYVSFWTEYQNSCAGNETKIPWNMDTFSSVSNRNIKSHVTQTKTINPEQKPAQEKEKLLKRLHINENKLFTNPKNTKTEYGKEWILQTENYPNGEEKNRFYYKKISDSRATISITRRSQTGEILFENEVTVNDFNLASNFINNPGELVKNIKNSDRFFDNPKNTFYEHGKGWVVRTENYDNGEEKTRFYCKWIDNNRALVSVTKRNVTGEIVFENEVTINDFSLTDLKM